jgi:hypothetical protein
MYRLFRDGKQIGSTFSSGQVWYMLFCNHCKKSWWHNNLPYCYNCKNKIDTSGITIVEVFANRVVSERPYDKV